MSGEKSQARAAQAADCPPRPEPEARAGRVLPKSHKQHGTKYLYPRLGGHLAFSVSRRAYYFTPWFCRERRL